MSPACEDTPPIRILRRPKSPVSEIPSTPSMTSLSKRGGSSVTDTTSGISSGLSLRHSSLGDISDLELDSEPREESKTRDAEMKLLNFLLNNSKPTSGRNQCRVYLQGVRQEQGKEKHEKRMRNYFEENFGHLADLEVCFGLAAVTFEHRNAAMQAIKHLGGQGFHIRVWNAPDLDESNVYFSHLPKEMGESELNSLVERWASVATTKIMRNGVGSTGSGFTRLHDPADSPKVIRALNGAKLAGCSEPIEARLAFKGSKREPHSLFATPVVQYDEPSLMPSTPGDEQELSMVLEENQTPPAGSQAAVYICDSGVTLPGEPSPQAPLRAPLTGILLPPDYEDMTALKVQWIQRDGASQPLLFFSDPSVCPVLGVYEPDQRMFIGRRCESVRMLQGCELIYETQLSGQHEPHLNYPKIPTAFHIAVPSSYELRCASSVSWRFVDGEFRPLLEYEGLPSLIGLKEKGYYLGKPISEHTDTAAFFLPEPILTKHLKELTPTKDEMSRTASPIYFEEFPRLSEEPSMEVLSPSWPNLSADPHRGSLTQMPRQESSLDLRENTWWDVEHEDFSWSFRKDSESPQCNISQATSFT